ncbi:hypothetical protein UFOVP455_56 [uncultured Caudovirales phage]|uniref:Uncharacterized protein n=1 Tax=uncultured Caudovirales phage TaxID=2100421 RepID=A0A6J5MGZ5_9CAUD|nr:hypothetical protein UFOVP455_56 [uncultured Caudovirales phage]
MIVTNELPNNAVTFWYDINQPRRNQGKQEALERWKTWKKEHQEPMVRSKGNPRSKGDKLREMWHSIHHISGERSDGKADNLFICESDKQHENLELQLKQLQIELVKSGAIGFSLGAKKYYVTWKPLADFISQWRAKNEQSS